MGEPIMEKSFTTAFQLFMSRVRLSTTQNRLSTIQPQLSISRRPRLSTNRHRLFSAQDLPSLTLPPLLLVLPPHLQSMNTVPPLLESLDKCRLCRLNLVNHNF